MRLAACLLGLALIWAGGARAEALSRETSCPAFLRARQQNPHAPGMQAQSGALVAVIAPYIPRDTPPQGEATLVLGVVARAATWCGRHAAGTLGEAVDAAAAEGHIPRRVDGISGPPSVLLVSPVATPAQKAPDQAALDAVALFGRSCLAFDGPVALRGWAAAQGYVDRPLLAFRPGAPTGEVAHNFAVSTGGAGLALISMDGGACEVVSQQGVAGRFATALEHATWPAGFTLVLRQEMLDPVVHSRQRLYDAEGRGWGQDVSLTGRDEAAGGRAGMVVLMALPRRGGI